MEKYFFECRTYTLTSSAEIEYCSHINGWQTQNPDCYMSAQAIDEDGKECKIFWFFENLAEVEELDSLDYDNCISHIKY